MQWTVTAGGGSVVVNPFGLTYHTLGASEGTQTVTVRALRGADSLVQTFSSTAVSSLVLVGAGDSYYYYYYSNVPLFQRDSIDVTAGTTVGWLWPGCGGCEAHNLTFEDDPYPPVSSPNQVSGRHFRTFTGSPRTIRYRCTNHSTSFTSGMVGTVPVVVN